MNPKIALFLSATLTAFVVATLSGVVNKVISTPPANTIVPVQVAAQPSATVTLEQPTDLPAPTMQTPLSPEQAATLAAQAINRQDVYSVETSTYNGVDAYKVVFSSGDVVYIGFDSQVLAKTQIQPVVVSAPATNPSVRSNNNGGNRGGSGEHDGGEHEGGD